ncbi:MAG: BamA/TamA family outer membrane protein [Verrucomicrobia bacterium]|nr:BamA/TamA family outer membrane protein [Verrucomicrobiota bacterium]MBV9642155.1 BamA/TamA family outer membrane protein [Verrucomicrobiota bacterium]
MKCALAAFAVLLLDPLAISLLAQRETPPKAIEPELINNTAPPPNAAARVRFFGNTKFSNRELSTALADPLSWIQKRGLSMPLADDTAYYLRVFYRRRGYPMADVKYTIQEPYLDLNITEGPYYKLGTITFEGNKTFKPSTLKEYMIGTTRARYSQFQRELPFVEADLITGTTLVQSFYVAQGFPKVDMVKLTTIPDNRTGTVNAIVTINEGPRFFFGPISFSNNFGIAQKEFSAKIRSLTNPPKPYSEAELQNLQRDLTFIFKSKGYYSASVTVTPDFNRVEGGRVPMSVDSVPGAIYQFGAVTASQEPNARLRPEFLPRRLAPLRGETYDPQKLKDLYRKLYLSGLYDSIDIQEVPQPDDTIALVAQPQEAKPKELGFYGGYDTFDGIILGASYTNRNIDGLGRIFSFHADYTGRGPDGEISYENPWFLESDIDFSSALGVSIKDLIGYSIQNYYARIRLTKSFRKGIQTTAFLEAKESNVSSIVIRPQSLAGPTSYQLITLGLSQTLDFRDSPTNPRRGWVIDGSASFSGNADGGASFARFTGRYSTYFSFGKTLLALGARLGYMNTVQSAIEVPIDERFFNGGSTTVRSFYETDLSPKDTENHPIGGLARSIFNIEYNVPIYGDLVGAAFLDAGGTGNTPFDNFATGVGGGIRYNLPIGPVRVDYGVNPAPRKNQSVSVLSLSFGFAF